MSNLDNDKEELIQKLGNICHETYLGCDNLGNDDWRYSYSTEALIQLETDEASKAIDQYTQSKLKAFAGEVLDIVEAEYQKCSTLGRINEDGIRKLYVQSEYRHKVVKAIKEKAGIE